MKAITIREFGGPEVLNYEELPVPVIKDNQVLVKVLATSVNHLEIMVASGKMGAGYPVGFPWIPGYDVAGIVAETAPMKGNFDVGDEVYAKTTGASYAGYIVVDENMLARKPRNLSFIESASVPHVALTAWQGLFKYANLHNGQKILIHGAAGAVGSFAVQFAKNAGAYVYATASANDKSYLDTLGADVIIDYKTEDFTKIAKNIDLVFDLIGGESQIKSFSLLAENGKLVSTTGPADDSIKNNQHAMFMRVEPDGEILQTITQAIEAGKITCDVAMVYPLKDAKMAWDTFMHRSEDSKKFTHGKIVLEV